MAQRTLPEDDPEIAPFWQAAAEGKLLLKRCDACSKVYYFPRAVCPHCWSRKTSWIGSPGVGRIHSYTVVHLSPGPGFSVPYVLAYVDLDEGVRMLTNIVNCPTDGVEIGMPVKVTFEKLQEKVGVPLFEPAQ